MKVLVQRWLAKQLTGVESIRGCALNREADIVAMTWSATCVYVYLFDTLPKLRAIRKLVGDNSRIGIGTLFVLDASLMPADGVKTTPDEALTALHALFRDKVYTYRIEPDGPRIGQVHFRSFGRGDEREVWYGPDIAVRNLPFYKVWLKQPNAIKGEWLMANFGSEAFWKQADYTSERDVLRQQQRGFTQRYAWSQTFDGPRMDEMPHEAPPPPPPPRHHSQLERSYAQLGLPRSASSEDVRAAFRRMARELHPDVSTLPKEEAEHRFRQLNEAYTFIRVTMGW